MQQDPEFVNILRQLANGEIEPEEWVDWWNRKERMGGVRSQPGPMATS